MTIGYALPDEPDLRNRLQQGEELRRSMPVEVSLNEPICADRRVDLDHAHILRISTVEDIVAEKLRALLQQAIRNRTRRQDLLDIAVILTKQPQLDRERVADYLLREAAARDVPVSRTAFRSPELAERAGQGYAELQPTTRTLFIPFDEALSILHRFVDDLAIPE